MQQPPLFIINLPQGVKRRAFMQRQLDKFGLQGEFFPAINGRQLSPDYLARFKVAAGEEQLGRQLLAGELGCLFSHYEVCRKILAAGHKAALIFEDDAEFNADLVELFMKLDALAGNWDLAMLGYWTPTGWFPALPRWVHRVHPLSFWQRQTVPLKTTSCYLGPIIDQIRGTVGYYITAAGAAKVVELVESGEILPYDLWLNCNVTKLRLYGVYPSLLPMTFHGHGDVSMKLYLPPNSIFASRSLSDLPDEPQIDYGDMFIKQDEAAQAGWKGQLKSQIMRFRLLRWLLASWHSVKQIGLGFVYLWRVLCGSPQQLAARSRRFN